MASETENSLVVFLERNLKHDSSPLLQGLDTTVAFHAARGQSSGFTNRQKPEHSKIKRNHVFVFLSKPNSFTLNFRMIEEQTSCRQATGVSV